MNKKYICYDHSYILFESLFLTLIYYDIRQNIITFHAQVNLTFLAYYGN